MQQNNIESFKHLSQFRDIKDFNNNIEQWMIDVKSKFTKSELVGLKRLIRFCAKIAGVSNAKIATITKATHELDQYAISRSTFKRMTSKAQSLGLLAIHETERKNGSKSSNVYVFNRFEPSNEEQLNCAKTINSQTTQIKDKEIRNDEPSNPKRKVDFPFENSLDYRFVSDRVPREFVEQVCGFVYFSNAHRIEELYKCVYLSAKKFNMSVQEVIPVAVDSYRQLIRKMKKGIVTNPFGFFTGILRKKLKTLSITSMFNAYWEM